ncbi:LADA_0F02762g1_1 [Lachancea dasiensis]|uniref:LADA_0F02762g1_1 n=1 Tax=Lachancea dasiensis TaxID=1072105 RepID=A0A1G4JIU2_9SACH|nr:LADA_0F02762g1_1 [Lachancea dasiensis]
MSNYIGGDDAYLSNTFGKSLSLRVDGRFKAVSISPSGRDVVLAGRQGLYVVDLDDPFSAPRWLHHITSWEVADVQWSPHLSKPGWVVSTSNQKALVWNLARSSSNAIEHVLHGHFRAISDINFHPQHPEILATCSIDTYVHSWDMRSPRRAYYSASVWSAGVSQVKWNYQNPNVIASAHSNDVYVWDLRKGCTPLHSLKGHANSVNSIDFNKFNETEIMSSSNDGTVKFWNYAISDKEPQRTVVTDFPVARGRYLPFGKGFCVMPLIGGNNSVYLAECVTENGSEPVCKFQPIYVFKGHSDCVSDFLWRVRHSSESMIDDREFQLVTWSKDCDLRLWPVNETTYKKVHFEQFAPLESPLVDHLYSTYRQEPPMSRNKFDYSRQMKEHFVTKSGSEDTRDKNKVDHLAWVSGVKLHHANSPHDLFEQDKLQNLGEEVSMIGHKFPKVVFEKISVSTGSLILTLSGPWSERSPDDLVFLRIEAIFPPNYPCKKNDPVFKIEENRELSASKSKELTDQLQVISAKHTELGMYCLEACLRFLLGEKINLDALQDEEQLLNFDVVDQAEFEDLSSLDSSDMRSHVASGSSDLSDEEGVMYDDKTSIEGFTETKLDLDTTPVPKGCGATWTSSGLLVCFFALEGKLDKKQHNLQILNQRNYVNSKEGQKPEILFQDDLSASSSRPKRYVELHPASSEHNSENGVMASETDSNASSDSFGDVWNDIVRSDITLRTKLPVYSAFGKNLTLIPSDDGKSNASTPKFKNTVLVKDFSHLIADKRQLALEYKFTGDSLESICKHNADVAESQGMEDLAHSWTMMANLLIDREELQTCTFEWSFDGLGDRWFVKEAMSFFEKSKNVQMLAMLSCILMERSHWSEIGAEGRFPRKQQNNVVTFESDLHTGFPRSHQGSIASSVKSEDYFSPHQFRSKQPKPQLLAPSSMIPDVKIEILHDETLDLIGGRLPPLLDPAEESKYRSYRYQYAELLFYWGLLIHRAELLQFNTPLPAPSDDSWSIYSRSAPDSVIPLNATGMSYKFVEGEATSPFIVNCNYCELKIEGFCSTCGSCQHIMHAHCAKEWWRVSNECPSGCGCACVDVFDRV